jgi:hypothetical protein
MLVDDGSSPPEGGAVAPETDESGERYSHPNRGTLGQTYPGTQRLNLSAEQLHDHENDPSWKGPSEGRRPSTGAIIAIVVAIVVVALVVLLAAGVI